jgi:hypothetical protein
MDVVGDESKSLQEIRGIEKVVRGDNDATVIKRRNWTDF